MRLAAFIGAVVLGLAGCGDGQDAPVEPTAREVWPSTAAAGEAASTTTDEAVTTTQEIAGEEPTQAPAETQLAVQTDWLNETYLMRAYSGSDLADLTFRDGVSQQTVILDVVVDPADPQRVALTYTSADSEGYPLFVGAGIYRADEEGGTVREASTVTMEGWAVAAVLCPSTTTWDGGAEVVLEVEGCDSGAAQTVRWLRDAGDSFDMRVAEGEAPVVGAGGGVDVSGFDGVDFASPSGQIWCRMDGAGPWAACHFPEEMDSSGLPGREHCGEFVALAAIGVDRTVGWVCSGGVIAQPVIGSGSTAWFDHTGWEPVVATVGGAPSTFAVLPYGESLAMGSLTCSSSESGVRCTRTDTGAGFTVARRGVEQFGPQSDYFTGWDG